MEQEAKVPEGLNVMNLRPLALALAEIFYIHENTSIKHAFFR